MKKFAIFFVLITTSLLLWRCTKSYAPPEVTTDYGYLVVEGVVTPGAADSTIIKLSRTVKLAAKTTTRPELKAIVSVQSDQNVSYPLTETTNGNYVSPGLNLDVTKKYRLSIKTTNGKTYMSDFVAVKNAPPIDSIGYNVTASGITLYNNAHDATNATRYYRYEYQETWMFNSNFQSNWVAVATVPPAPAPYILSKRTAAQQVFTCWANNASSNIILGTTEKLAQDILSQNTIELIPSSSEKIGVKYSILLKQYALTTDAYSFWTQMKKTNEDLGSIFDAQPTSLPTNIHNVADAGEPVIGYLSVGSVATKRIYILKTALPISWSVDNGLVCVLDTAYLKDPISGANDVNLTLINVPPTAIAVDNLGSLGFSRSSKICGDCTLRGANMQPAFWK